MRLACMLLAAFLLAVTAAPAPAQAIKPATPSINLPTAPTPGVKAYRLTRKDGAEYVITTFKLDKGNYVVTDVRGKVTQHIAQAVASIEPIADDQVETASHSYEAPGSWNPGKTSPRSSSRTSARTSARTSSKPKRRASVYDYDWSSAYAAAGAGAGLGTTPTGIPLHMGPRGGIFHYSASGNKVYQKH